MQQIIPNLWFDDQAEEAAQFYTGIFKNSKIGPISHYSTEAPNNKPKGSVLTVAFELNGQQFLALNGGPDFTFNEAISFVVQCEDQAEIDYYWEKLSAVPEAEQCGWLKDKFGVSWQITPKNIAELVAAPDAEANARVMEALLKMKKIDIQALKNAANENTRA